MFNTFNVISTICDTRGIHQEHQNDMHTKNELKRQDTKYYIQINGKYKLAY